MGIRASTWTDPLGLTPYPAPQITQHGLDHSFDRHAAQWFGGEPNRSTQMDEWRDLIERTSHSSHRIPWSTGATETHAYLARIDNKWFAVQFDRTSGDLVTAFVPNSRQLSAMLSLLGK
ncbi:hypothetical protein [Streptomyces specialis]|uniref:hypothetical protein n=1 Tax=Streptomyces specialis TaxID=498367 RepID=UPI00131B2EE3|nr:hypothetical protein [Streptomyces specialis]